MVGGRYGDSVAGTRKERAEQTRHQLLAAARRLFAENGFFATSYR